VIIWILEKQLSSVWFLCGGYATLAAALLTAQGNTEIEGGVVTDNALVFNDADGDNFRITPTYVENIA